MHKHGLAYFAASNPNQTALVDPQGRSLSRAELNCAANQIAHALRGQGLRERDVLAILAPNCAEFMALYLGAVEIGLYVVPINWHLAPAEIAYLLEDCGARVLAVHERLTPLVRQLLGAGHGARPEIKIAIGRIPDFIGLDEMCRTQPGTRVADPRPGRSMMYTSATTGRPKAVDLPLEDAHRALARTIAFFNFTGIQLEDDNVHLCASMLYHAGPLEAVVVAIEMGHPVVLVDRWEPEQLLRLIDTHRVTTTFMVPSMFIRLLKLPLAVRTRYAVRSLRLVVHSAAPCPQEVKRQLIEWWGPVIWEGYGAAEGAGTAVNSVDWLQRPGTVGRPIPGSRVRVLDELGEELPPGRIGIIYFSRYTGDRFAYRNDPEKTRAAYRGDLLTVGDVGYLDEEGYLYICDRKVDMIICGGMNVYPAEIEQILVQHPDVFDCAVLGVPDELMGEAIRAVVQPIAGKRGDDALTAELMSFLRRGLSAAKLPRKMDYVTALPRDPNGKLFKRALREKYWEGHDRKI